MHCPSDTWSTNVTEFITTTASVIFAAPPLQPPFLIITLLNVTFVVDPVIKKHRDPCPLIVKPLPWIIKFGISAIEMVSIRLMSAPRLIVAPSFTSFFRSLAFVTTEPVDMHAVAPVIEVVPTLVPATESSPAPHAVHDAASTVDVNVPGTQLGQKNVLTLYRPGEHCGHATVDAHD